jgi:hypothetical protein
MKFGRQRALRDVLVLALLLVGFTALAVAFWMLTLNWAGILLPIGFVIGAYAQLRVEVREVELHPDRLFVRTFFREYPMPRAHIRRVLRSPDGAAIVEVLNGNRYAVTPPDVDGEELARTLEAWLASP